VSSHPSLLPAAAGGKREKWKALLSLHIIVSPKEKGRRQNVSILSPTLAQREWIIFLMLQPSLLPSYMHVSVKRVPE
jgi:hypothetical protein